MQQIFSFFFGYHFWTSFLYLGKLPSLWVLLSEREENSFTQIFFFFFFCNYVTYFLPIRINSIGGGHWEDMTTGWSVIWTWAIGGSSPWNVHITCLLQTRSCPKTYIWDSAVMWYWEHLYSKHDCIQLRFWWVNAEMYSSCGTPTQASPIRSLAN